MKRLIESAKSDRSTTLPPSLRVLILEDSPRDAKLVVSELQRGGGTMQYEVIDSPEVFQESLQRSDYDVILADYNLRHWTALDALAILKQSAKEIPLIVVTGSLGDEAAVECIMQGAADFVLKDRTARLPAAIQRTLEERRLRAERKIVSAENMRLALIVNSSDDAIFSVTRDGRIVTWNHGAERLYGYTAEEIKGEPFAILVPDESRGGLAANQEQLLRSEPVLHEENEHVRKDGARIQVLLTLSPIKDEQGEVEGISAIARDITERRHAEAENAKLVAAIEQSAEAVVITDSRGAIEYVNPAFTRMTGYSREEALGQNPRILKSDQQKPAYYRQLWETIAKGEIWQGELINRRKDGKLYTEEMNIAPVRNLRGEITHFIATKQDVTEEKSLQAQLQQAAKMEGIGRLAGGVAHDFNNLLTVINGYSELLLSMLGSDSKTGRYVREIVSAGDRATALTRQLLAFSRRQVLAPQVISLNDVVSNLEKMLKRMIGEDIKLSTVLQPVLGRVKADPGQIEQVIMNLVVNARDAMPSGGSLTVATSDVDLTESYSGNHLKVKPGRYVMLTVADTGTGMSVETQEHIFEPFFTTKAEGKGTGLGLATVYGIVKQSEGGIWVRSELGRGTEFKIYLPTVTEELAATGQEKVKVDSAACSETILVVEDEEGVRSLVKVALISAGYSVLESSDGENALAACARHQGPIHLLLTDVVMPQMSGPAVAKKIVALRPDIKVLYMSGYTDDAIVHHGVRDHNIPFIQKPFTPVALRRKIREVLGRGRD